MTDHTTDARPACPSGEGGHADRVYYTVVLPVTPLLNANDRVHHMARHAITQRIRADAARSAGHAGVPPLLKAHVTCELRFGTGRRRRDPGNWYPSAKAAVDGLVDAGVLPDDDALHVIGPDMRIGPTVDGIPTRGRFGQIVLHVHEITEEVP